jgi:hypothetical protein
MIPGMPNIPGLPSGPGGIVQEGLNSLISFGGAFAIGLIFGDRWGIFNEFGIPVLLADNVTSVEFQNTASVANAPLEKGTFASYNKVQDPYTATVQMTKGSGGTLERGAFIAQLEALSRSTLLFNVLTPEYVHRNAAITGFGYRRLPNEGNRIIIANIELKEVREVEVQYDQEDTENPEDADSVDGGEVETGPAESVLSQGARAAGEIATGLRDKGLEFLDQVQSAFGDIEVQF